jgi:hypothetical protein
MQDSIELKEILGVKKPSGSVLTRDQRKEHEKLFEKDLKKMTWSKD